MSSQGKETRVRDALLTWFDEHGRDLPWRQTRDPWVILVSEIMLQQTQVSRVLERLPSFLNRFPTPTAMASQPPSAVIAEWTGLGYNRRALNLHRAASQIAERHHGRVPEDLDQLLDLPGIGPYTARAVRSFAFEQKAAVVDTNVGRVLARWTGGPLSASQAQRLADDLVPEGETWAWNQAIMELGAVVCRKTALCERCPVSSECTWYGNDCAGPDPALGSAAVSKPQSRFEGSDRQGRAKLVRRLASGPVVRTDLPAVMGWPDDPDRARRVVDSLLSEGMVVERSRVLTLPE